MALYLSTSIFSITIQMAIPPPPKKPKKKKKLHQKPYAKMSKIKATCKKWALEITIRAFVPPS